MNSARRSITTLALLGGLLAEACIGGAPAPSMPSGFSAPSPHANSDWTTYMGDSLRTGVGPATPSAANPHRTWTAAVDGDVYAQPLVLGSAIFVATEQNSVYQLDGVTGAVRWRTRLGDPVPSTQLECGYIPSNGITSTPVIDGSAGLLYAVAFLNAPQRHEIFALKLADGSIAWHRNVDPPNEDPGHEQQRGSLNLSRGYVYFSFGGFTGDCGNYHGWVMAAPTDNTGSLLSWHVQTFNRGAIWAPPGPVITPDGDVWVATGDSDAVTAVDVWDGANSVFRLPRDLSRPKDHWIPGDWLHLNRGDIDQGSVAPVVLPSGLVFDTGKEGVGYLIPEDHLGGIHGEVFKAQVCQTGGDTGGSFGGVAVRGDMLYVPCKDGLVALRVDNRRRTFAEVWHGTQAFADTPVLAYGAVWTVTSESGSYKLPWRDGRLWALDPATGAVKAQIALGEVPHFASPTAADGAVYVSGLGRVYAISPAS